MKALKRPDSGSDIEVERAPKYQPVARNNQIVLRKRKDIDKICEGDRLIRLAVEDSDEKFNSLLWCDVVCVGPGGITSNGSRVPMDVKIGDVVGLLHGHGAPFVVAGKQLIVAEDGSVAVVLQPALDARDIQ
jgi:co-chaperonin GroES (HSP10)